MKVKVTIFRTQWLKKLYLGIEEGREDIQFGAVILNCEEKPYHESMPESSGNNQDNGWLNYSAKPCLSPSKHRGGLCFPGSAFNGAVPHSSGALEVKIYQTPQMEHQGRRHGCEREHLSGILKDG